jgi:hypothetical protein
MCGTGCQSIVSMPVLAAIVVVSLGVGVNTAVFSRVYPDRPDLPREPSCSNGWAHASRESPQQGHKLVISAQQLRSHKDITASKPSRLGA